MIRFIIACIFVFLYLFLTLPVLLVLWLIGKKWPHIRDKVSFRMIQWAFSVILRISGLSLTVKGKENIPAGMGVLYIGNHRSIFDIMIAYTQCPDITGFVAKKEMDRFPVFNIWMRFIHCLFLDRSDLRQGMETIKTAISMVKEGISVFIFPEGTRSKSPDELELLEFHEGSFRVATRSGCPIIPIALHNTQNIFEAHLPKLVKTRVTMVYLPPIWPGELTREEQKHLGANVRDMIRDVLADIDN